MDTKDNFTGNLSFFGRLADEITREVIPYKSFSVSIQNHPVVPIYKEDGFFVFSDLEHSPVNYRFHFTARLYQSRVVEKILTSDLPVEMSFPGEDEIYILIKEVQNGSNKKIKFDQIPFIKTIPKGAAVYGESGFSTTLKTALEGVNVDYAELNNVNGLNGGEILRIVRSNNILMKPGPYYTFPMETTVLILKFVDNSTPARLPLAQVKCKIREVNEVPLNSTIQVGGVDVYTVGLPAPGGTIILGPENNLTPYANEKGDAVFYFPGDTYIKKLKLEITADGYIPLPMQEIALLSKQRKFQSFELTKI